MEMIIEAVAGASTWASGNHVCSGTIGILIANPMNKAHHNKCETWLKNKFSILAVGMERWRN